MSISIYLTCIIILFIEVKYSNSKEIGIKVGDKLNICCTLKFQDKNPLVMFKESIRLSTLYQKTMTPGDWGDFENNYKDFKMEHKDDTICIIKEKVSKGDGNLALKCIEMTGPFGGTIQQEEFLIKVYEDLIFNKKIEDITRVSVGETLILECSVSGSPDLKVLWRKQNQGVVSQGTNVATLSLMEVTTAMNGDKYTCEASISVPNKMINTTTTIEVLFPPEIDVVLKPFHTDIGIKEEVKVTVRGNPPPKLDCPLLNIPANRIIVISNPSPTIFEYKMIFDNITQNDIRDYTCIATNDKGTVEKIVSLILGPVNLRITSPNDTAYANYYLLKWQVNSKAKIHLSKIEIDEYESDLDSKVSKLILEGGSVQPITVSVGNEENNWLFQYSHHILNLTENKLYRISLTMCRKEQCIDAEKALYMKIPKFNGNNNIDPRKLASIQYPGDDPKKVGSVNIGSIFITVVNLVLIDLVRRH